MSRASADGAREPIWVDSIDGSAEGSAAGTDHTRSDPPATSSLAALARETPAPSRAVGGAEREQPRAAAATVSPSGGGEALERRSGHVDGGEQSVPGADGAAPGTAGPRARLSLRELGVDRGSNPFIGSVTDLPTERQLANQRLRQSLRADLAQRDQARGLGPEGPAVTAVTQIVMASAAAPNTSALLQVRTNGAGAVTLVDVLEADRDSDEWQRIARELVRALAGRPLRVPSGSNGVSFQLRVVSRAQLPSGADPGLAVDVLGIQLKKGDGPRSTKISILSPVIKEIEVPDSDGLRVPVVSFAPIGARGDLADIGAVARRLVTAYLVAMDTDFRPESTPPAAASTPAPPDVTPATP